MDHPSPVHKSRAKRYHTIALAMLFSFFAGCTMVAAGFYPYQEYLSGIILVCVGGIMAFASLLVGYSVKSAARQLDRMVEGSLLACWSYTESEWEAIRTGMSWKNWKWGGSLVNSPWAQYGIIALIIILPVLVIVDRVAAINYIPRGIGDVILVLILLILGVTGIFYLISWDSERSTLGPRQVLIAPTCIVLGNDLAVFDSSSLVTAPWDKEDSLFGVQRTGGTILDRVVLDRGTPWFLEFHIRSVSEASTWVVNWKIPVPPGEEQTAERVLAFFTPRNKLQ